MLVMLSTEILSIYTSDTVNDTWGQQTNPSDLHDALRSSKQQSHDYGETVKQSNAGDPCILLEGIRWQAQLITIHLHVFLVSWWWIVLSTLQAEDSWRKRATDFRGRLYVEAHPITCSCQQIHNAVVSCGRTAWNNNYGKAGLIVKLLVGAKQELQ